MSESFNETPAFGLKSVWKASKSFASIEVFLGRLEKEMFLDYKSEFKHKSHIIQTKVHTEQLLC